MTYFLPSNIIYPYIIMWIWRKEKYIWWIVQILYYSNFSAPKDEVVPIAFMCEGVTFLIEKSRQPSFLWFSHDMCMPLEYHIIGQISINMSIFAKYVKWKIFCARSGSITIQDCDLVVHIFQISAKYGWFIWYSSSESACKT